MHRPVRRPARRAVRILVGPVAVVGLAAVASGACSRDLGYDEWLVRADEVCAQQQAAADADPAPSSPLPGDSLRHLADQSGREVAALRELPQAEEMRSSIAEYLLTLEHRVDVLRNYADELDAAPADGSVPGRARLEDVTAEAITQALALGLEVCAGGIDVRAGGPADATTTTEAVMSGGAGVTEAPPVDDEDDIDTVDGPG